MYSNNERSALPQLQWGSSSNPREVTVGCEKHESVTDTQLGNEGVDRANLKSATATAVSERGGLDVILQIGNDHRQHGEEHYDPIPRLGPHEPLQQLLKHEPRRDDGLAPDRKSTRLTPVT